MLQRQRLGLAFSKGLALRAGSSDSRLLAFSLETLAQDELPEATSAWLDGLMSAEAAPILFRGVDSMEPVPGKEGQSFIYFPPLEIGPVKAQIRMTVELQPPMPGCAEIKVLEINPGVLDPSTSKVEYQKDPTEYVEATTSVETSWHDQSTRPGLRVFQKVRQDFKIYIPWWFPVPGPLLEGVLKPFITEVTKINQQGVFQGIRERVR